jgi:hypothetical protein
METAIEALEKKFREHGIAARNVDRMLQALHHVLDTYRSVIVHRRQHTFQGWGNAPMPYLNFKFRVEIIQRRIEVICNDFDTPPRPPGPPGLEHARTFDSRHSAWILSLGFFWGAIFWKQTTLTN